jgi:hypothetical protein
MLARSPGPRQPVNREQSEIVLLPESQGTKSHLDGFQESSSLPVPMACINSHSTTGFALDLSSAKATMS